MYFFLSNNINNEVCNATLGRFELVLVPTSEHKSTPDTYGELIVLPDNFPAKEWRQIGGDAQSKSIVLQLGFARIASGMVPAGCTYLRGYALKVAYLSLPIEAKEAEVYSC